MIIVCNFQGGKMAKENIVEKTVNSTTQFMQNATAEELVALADEKFASGIRNGWYGRIVNGIADFGYSVRNTTLVLLQNPNASKINSMSGWNYNGRAIAKGSKGLKIVAPVFDGNKATGYKINYAFDKSQTTASANGKGVKDVKCNQEFIEKHFAKVKEIVANSAKGYTFDENAQPFDYDKTKKLFIDNSLSPTEVIACMIDSIATMKAGVQEPEVDEKNPNIYKIDDTKASTQMTASAIAYLACRQLGIDSPLTIPSDFAEYTDDEVKKLSSNLNFAKGVAGGIAGALEYFVLDVSNADKLAEAKKLDEQDSQKASELSKQNSQQNSMQMQNENAEEM